MPVPEEVGSTALRLFNRTYHYTVQKCVKIKSVLCLIKHYAMKAYGGVDV
jgi:hypothetical protein